MLQCKLSTLYNINSESVYFKSFWAFIGTKFSLKWLIAGASIQQATLRVLSINQSRFALPWYFTICIFFYVLQISFSIPLVEENINLFVDLGSALLYAVFYGRKNILELCIWLKKSCHQYSIRHIHIQTKTSSKSKDSLATPAMSDLIAPLNDLNPRLQIPNDHDNH